MAVITQNSSPELTFNDFLRSYSLKAQLKPAVAFMLVLC